MTYHPQKPRYTLPLAGKDYELEGSFALLEAVENALKDDILRITSRVMEMPASETARLIAALLTASGEKITAQGVGRILFEEIGLASDGYALLKLHLYAALRIFVSSPPEREKVAADMGEMLGKWQAPPASPGDGSTSSA